MAKALADGQRELDGVGGGRGDGRAAVVSAVVGPGAQDLIWAEVKRPAHEQYVCTQEMIYLSNNNIFFFFQILKIKISSLALDGFDLTTQKLPGGDETTM
jgi:hypothetical protein